MSLQKSKAIITISIIGLILCIMPLAALADGDYIKNFKNINTYSAEQFTDIGTDWYADAVKAVYELNVMKGTGDLFNPNGNLTNAEAMTLVARIHSIYTTGKEEFKVSEPWYQSYIDYLVLNGIDDCSLAPNATTTRAYFSVILANAVGSSELKQKNEIIDGELLDVDGWYSKATYMLYRAGVLSGSDNYGTFNPDSSITRAEVAAIVMRVIAPSTRVPVNIIAKTHYTVDAPLEGNSWENFKQRAIVANLKYLLSDEPKDANWDNDVWTTKHEEIASENIYISSRDLYIDYQSSGSQHIYVPNRYLGKSGDGYSIVGTWNLYTGFNSVISSGYTGSMPGGIYGDLYLSKPGVAGYTETTKYSSYTAQVQKLIDDQWVEPTLSEDRIKSFISANIEDAHKYAYRIGKLLFREEKYYIQNSQEYEFSIPQDAEYQVWCKEHLGGYVLAVISKRGFDAPYMLAELNGYAPEERNVTAASWDYNGQSGNTKLIVKWNDNFNFANPVKLDLKAINDAVEKDSTVNDIRRHTVDTEIIKDTPEKDSVEYEEKLRTVDFGEYNKYKDKIVSILLSVSSLKKPLKYQGISNKAISLRNLDPKTIPTATHGAYNIRVLEPVVNGVPPENADELVPSKIYISHFYDNYNSDDSFRSDIDIQLLIDKGYLKISGYEERSGRTYPIYSKIILLDIGLSEEKRNLYKSSSDALYFLGNE